MSCDCRDETMDNNAPIHTSGPEGTNRFLQELLGGVYSNINTQINQLATTESAVTVERQISLRCLQPPPPLPGVHYIQQVYEDPQPSIPIRITELRPRSRALSPITLRERPPRRSSSVPPSHEIQRIPHPIPAPRSIVIDRFEAPIKPRDIIIERWLPYGPSPPPVKIVKPPIDPPKPHPPPIKTINIHAPPPVRIVLNFKRLGVTLEDPDAYESHYGPSLLDSHTLVEQARREGVPGHIDITCRCVQHPITRYPDSCNCHCFCARHGPGCPNIRRFADTQAFNNGNGEVHSDFVVN